MIFSLIYIMFASIGVEFHDFHLSRTDIKYVEESHNWQISSHIFIDDLEKSLEERVNLDLHLFSDNEHPDADTYIYEYLNEKLIIIIDGKACKVKWIGKEMSDDLLAAWCYLEILNRPVESTVELDNNILHELFDDQSNMTVVKLPNRKKDYFVFDKSQDFEKIELK